MELSGARRDQREQGFLQRDFSLSDDTQERLEQSRPWHAMNAAEVAHLLQTDPVRGLSDGEVVRRRELHGPNELTAVEGVSALQILLAQLKNVLILILLLATVVSAFLGHGVEAAAIAVIVLFAVFFGFAQEYRAERAIESLRKMAAPTASVIRDGVQASLPARELVPGDVVVLHAGDKIPADARLFESMNFRVEEAVLTGESTASEKSVDSVLGNAGVGDRSNMVFLGTVAVYGRAKAIVTSTGDDTEFGRVAGALRSVERSATPLQENLDRVGKTLAITGFIIVAVIVALGLLRNEWTSELLVDMLIFGIALAIAVVPEALPAVVTISLALGVQRMVKRHALVRRLPAVETLGNTSVICSDKTGTLTKDEMTAVEVWADGRNFSVTGAGYDPAGAFLQNGDSLDPSGEPILQELLAAAVLSSDARLQILEGRWSIVGDPTEAALIVLAKKADLEAEDVTQRIPRVDEIPFSSETKRMTTFCDDGGRIRAFSKGAPEVLVPYCTHIRTNGGIEPLEEATIRGIDEVARTMAAKALRVLAVATKHDASKADGEDGMTLLGLVGMIDPPRPEAKVAIQTCRDAGIRVVMITGDHPATARAVADQLGLLREGRLVTGGEIEEMGEETLHHRVTSIEVYARVSPAQKLRIVTALQAHGQVVAMTGDGVNDAPALKRANIGIAMGIAGTDVARDAADMMLTDDNFASIVAAVEEGRAIFLNIKKYLMYLLSSNFGEIWLMTLASIFGFPLPLTAVQLLYVNLATDGLPALALAVDPISRNLMQRPPRDARRGIFTRPVVTLLATGGLWSGTVIMGLYAWANWNGRSENECQTLTFVCLVLLEFFKAYVFRSDRDSTFKAPFANRWLNLAIGWELILLSLVVYVPFLQHPFNTFAMPLADWAIVIPIAASVVPVLEIAKWAIRRSQRKRRLESEI